MIKYFMRGDSNNPPQFSYVEGEDNDWAWTSVQGTDRCIEVPQIPSSSHIWDWDTSQWVLSPDIYLSQLRAKRNTELARTDKFVLADYQISEEDLATAKTYRQALRDAPNHENIEDCVMPVCPEVLQ